MVRTWLLVAVATLVVAAYAALSWVALTPIDQVVTSLGVCVAPSPAQTLTTAWYVLGFVLLAVLQAMAVGLIPSTSSPGATTARVINRAVSCTAALATAGPGCYLVFVDLLVGPSQVPNLTVWFVALVGAPLFFLLLAVGLVVVDVTARRTRPASAAIRGALMPLSTAVLLGSVLLCLQALC